MKRHTILALACATLLVVPSAASSQVGVAVHVGTLGLGADLAVKVAPKLALRAGGNFFPIDPTIDAADISYSFDLPTQFTGLLDFYPGGPFHLSGGVLITGDVGLTGELTGTVNVGGTLYQAADVGDLTATFTAGRKVAPYFGIGLGDPAGSRFGFFLDLGVGLWGKPTIALAADNGVISTLPATDPIRVQFDANLAQQQADTNADLESLKVYPVLSIGFSIGFGQ